MLVDCGVDLEVSYGEGWTPLFKAASTNHPDILEYLIDHNASVKGKTKANWNALHFVLNDRNFNMLGN